MELLDVVVVGLNEGGRRVRAVLLGVGVEGQAVVAVALKLKTWPVSRFANSGFAFREIIGASY